MTKEEINNLLQDIEDVSSNFENEPWTDNVKLLKEDFNSDSLNTPNHYLEIIDELLEVVREARVLFLYSIFNRVCKEEGKLYYFNTPFEAGMIYEAVIKNEGSFSLLDEDGHYREIFTSERFVYFISNLYWELIDNID